MSEVIIPVAKPVVAFGRRNASEERIRLAEEELKALRSVPLRSAMVTFAVTARSYKTICKNKLTDYKTN
jgi:hypothetical protein